MIRLGIATLLTVLALSAQPPQQGPQSELVREGQRLMREGKLTTH